MHFESIREHDARMAFEVHGCERDEPLELFRILMSIESLWWQAFSAGKAVGFDEGYMFRKEQEEEEKEEDE